ncbi:MAG: iron-sulfur cluster loop [Desulfurococcaceae archaeon]
MELIGIDVRQVERVARLISKNKEMFVKYIDVYDERFFPPKESDQETVVRYLMVMVSMDHRLSRPGKPYEVCLPDGCYHGADLLYRLGRMKLDREPLFFEPRRLANVSAEDVKGWLCVGEVCPPDPELRAALLRDLGQKLEKLYGGSAVELLRRSNGRMRGSPWQPGLVDNLKSFMAYSDPLEKKSILLAKFLEARGLFSPVDDIGIPVDNHLTRIALRLGLVVVSGALWKKIREGQEFTSDEDLLLRLTVKMALERLAKDAGLSHRELDDTLWRHGRETCLRGRQPLCDKCALRKACKAAANSSFMVDEHVFYNTWYY